MPSIDEILQNVTGGNPLSPSFRPVISNLPRARTGLLNKYEKYGAVFSALPPNLQNALIDIDTQRAAGGATPLTELQTGAALSTAISRKPFTPPSNRSIWNVPGNFVRDLSEIVRSIPRLPFAIGREIRDLPNLPQAISQGEGNIIQRVAQAPGIRLLPGSYLAANLAQGPSGLKEALTHPLYSALDVIPIADQAAGLTKVGKAAESAAALAGTKPRRLAAIATKSLDDEGKLVLKPRIERFQLETKMGQTMAQLWGKMNRLASRDQAQIRQEIVNAVRKGDPLPDTLSTEIGELGHQVYNLRKNYEDLVPEWPRLIDKFTQGDYTGLTPRELAFKNDVSDLTNKMGIQLADMNDIHKFVDDAGNTEFYDTKRFTKLDQARTYRDEMNAAVAMRNRIANPDEVARPLDTVLAEIESARTLKDRKKIRAGLYELEARGWDTRNLREMLRTTKGRVRFDTEYPRTVFDDTTKVQNYTKEQLIPILKGMTHRVNGKLVKDAKADRIAIAMADGVWKRVDTELDGIMQRSDRAAFPPEIARNIRSLKDREKYVNNLKVQGTLATPEAAFDAASAFERAYNRTAPDRFVPYIVEETKRRFTERVIPHLPPEQVGEVAEAIRHAIWNKVPGWLEPAADDIPLSGGLRTYKNIAREVEGQWRKLRDEGFNPLFVHTVRPHKVGGVLFPLIGEVPNNITSAKMRTLDLQPGIKDFSLALTHQAIELLTREASFEYINHIIQNYGVRESNLRESLFERAKMEARSNPRVDASGNMLDVNGHLQRLMNRGWTSFDPRSEGYFWGSKKIDNLEQDRYWIPKHLAQTLRQLHDPKSLFNGVFDAPTKLFRTSVVALSPRTLLYNLIGGAVMVAGQGGLQTFRHARQAWQMVHEAQIPQELKSAGVGQMGRLFEDLDAKSFNTKGWSAFHYLTGKTLRRWWDEIQQSKTYKAAAGIPQKSYDFNSLIDDWYRTMAFLEGKDKALMKGLDADTAAKAGVELARKSLQDWMGMTPLERSIMKSIFPFYGFMQHAIRYVLQYPIDHPLRAEILGKLGYSELQEQGEILPHKFLSWLFVGDESNKGTQNALSLGSLNPFGDVGNLMTLSGFLGATNPVIQTILESVGVTQGEAELYPSLRYDPETGRLQASQTNPLLAFAHNVIPQSELLTSLLGVNSDFNEQMRRNPQNGLRRLASSAGLPILWRQFKPTEEIMRAELARLQTATDVRNDAMKTGEWGTAARYPSLQDALSKLRALPPETLSPFTPAPNERELLRKRVEEILGATPAPASAGYKQAAGGI